MFLFNFGHSSKTMIIKLFIVVCIFLAQVNDSQADVTVYDWKNDVVADFDSEAAAFGPSFPSAGLKGFVLTTNPKNACLPIAPAPTIRIASYQWIALIPRNTGREACDFDLKVKNAQDANFSAVIVYNYEDELLTMGSNKRKINISSTMITKTDGLMLLTHFIYNTSTITPFYVKIRAEGNFNFGQYLIPFAVTVVTMFFALIGCMLIKCCLERRRSRLHRLPRSALKELKTKKFAKGDRWDVCAICLDDYVEGAKLRILPCEHAYHMKCIDPWLLNSRRQCPVCKRYVFPQLVDPDQTNSDEQQQTQTSNERTPLIEHVDHSPPSRTRYVRRSRLIRAQRINQTTDENEGEHVSDGEQNLVESSRILRTQNRRSARNSSSRRYRRLVNENASEITNYGSLDQANTERTRSADFFVGSIVTNRNSTTVSTISSLEAEDGSEHTNDTLLSENIQPLLNRSGSSSSYDEQ